MGLEKRRIRAGAPLGIEQISPSDESLKIATKPGDPQGSRVRVMKGDSEMLKLYKNSQGKKLYPVCSWSANQHKLYNAHDGIMNEIYDMENSDQMDSPMLGTLYERQELIEHLIMVFDQYVFGGIVYATWEDRNAMKDLIAAYDIRHDMAGFWK